MKRLIGYLILAFSLVAPVAAFGQSNTVMVGGQAMYPTKDIIENAMNSADHTTLVAAVKAAGLVDTLKGAGRSPFSLLRMRRSRNFLRAPSIRC